ncbi:soluble lamin-associated protein of 75 kDa isoform X1 [Alligator sinensis]|uniref:Soluble lamin-associated protein of 75 kDa isoform X1 n=1 Tax=Alligator sinensis TaxID=38654 RepID=A0A3Q0HKD9_ALLSI|nr:soluble lamin-associated protein of 75 kDa isoform X1 [Alligator sinensis]XP_025072425.1 soluble lamin-associated protein of 75 kDa isoform X1 [Alligator sinensis]
MAFPVDMLDNYSHEDLESSAEDYMSDLRCGDPDNPEFLSVVSDIKIPISLSTVGFVPLYGGDQTHKVLALFAPEDALTAVALYLADQWWAINDIVKTSVPSREGLQQVKTVGERVVLYVLNRIIYRKQEIEKNEIPFLCHSSSDYAKVLWKKGEAIGFYSVKPAGSICSSYLTQSYQLPVLDTMFVRKKHRGKDFGLTMLEDFVDSFTEDALGLRYPLSSFMYAACKQYFEKYPGDHDLLWEVEGAGHWFQRTPITTILQREILKMTAESSQKENNSSQTEELFLQSAMEPEMRNEQNTETETQLSTDSSKDTTDMQASSSAEFAVTPVSTRTRSSHLKRPRIGKNSKESELEAPQGEGENIHQASESGLEPVACASESSEELEERGDNTVENEEESVPEDEDTSLMETEELRTSPSEKQDEKQETPLEPLNGELTEESIKTSLMAEEENANEVLDGESKLQSDSPEEESLTVFVPLILDSSAKSSEDTASDKVLNAIDSEILPEESTSVGKEGSEEEQQEVERKKSSVESANTVTSASKEEPSDNGLPNSVITEPPEESVSENVSPKTTSSLEEQNEEVGRDSQEAPVVLGQSSLIVVELEDVSFQQHSEGQKNQSEEQSEESAEQMDQYTQTAAERTADSSSEEAEIEVPIVDRRNLRRKAKGYKGPPKKKGKPA